MMRCPRSPSGSSPVPGEPEWAGSYPGPYGPALVVAVSAPPVDGRATHAALSALAAALGVRSSALAVRTGLASRDKLVTVTNPPADLAARLGRLREADR